MSSISTRADLETGYRLCFRPLIGGVLEYVFPCDAQGRVDLDTLSRAALCDYLYARAVTGLLFFRPAVEPQLH